MSTSTESCHDLDMAEPESRENVYSSASSYSTYSREVKYIFNPADDSIEDYSDYSHINPCSKQNYISHTPNTSTHVSGKENRTPRSSRNDHVFDPQLQSLRSCSSYSSNSRDRGQTTSLIEEDVYSTSHYGHVPGKHGAQADNTPRERTYFSPRSEVTSYPYARHSIQVWKNNNNNVTASLHHQNVQKQTLAHQDTYTRHGRNNGPVLNTFHTQHPLSNAHHNFNHYQQPSIHLSAGSESSYQQKVQNHNNPAGHEPPYPMPPRYNHQHHARRKTWSPPTLKMSLLNSNSQGTRVCYSNDSLDISDEAALERKTQSLSEDLDVTPPKLAPISGVLAQKPGPNLIKPIAFKPVQVSGSPLGHVTRRQYETDGSGAHDKGRPQTLKDSNLQNGRSNMGAFNSMTKFQYQNSVGGNHLPSSSDHAVDSAIHPQSLTAHSYSTNSASSSVSSWQHNSSSASHQNVSNNTYSNVPAISNMSANASHLPGNETSEFSRNPEGTELAQPLLRVSFHTAEGTLQVPSPSDSGVCELEAMLREKDAEINTLREVMDRNERAIFQVYEERKNLWLQNTQEIQNDYECKLKAQSRKAYKTEQVLSLQVYKLQQEQKTVQDEKEMVVSERDSLQQKVEESQSQITELKLALETALAGGRNSALNKSAKEDKFFEGLTAEDDKNKDNSSLQEELTLKNKELITLKSKLHTFQADIEKKNREMAEKSKEVSSKSEEIKFMKDELLRLKDPAVLVEAAAQTHAPSEVVTSENIKPSMLGDRAWTISGLQEELAEVLSQVVLLKEEHEKERQLWLDEKNRVVRYQKQLQLNYVQMQRKNVTLETEVQQLTLELESRDMKLIALTGEESVC